VDRFGNYLYNFAIGRLRNHQNAENVVQETFLAALHSQDRFSGESSERTWLTSILKHKIVDFMRKSYRERPVSELQDPELGIDQFFDQTNRHKKLPSKWLPDPDKLLENKEFWEVFRDCMDKLPSLINDAFSLKEIEQMGSTEICKILNITLANYWVLLHRARLQLRQCLEGNWFEISKDH
jgi:RNA polymerase sigma-70 factor (ECF subfamily)